MKASGITITVVTTATPMLLKIELNRLGVEK